MAKLKLLLLLLALAGCGSSTRAVSQMTVSDLLWIIVLGGLMIALIIGELPRKK